MTMHDNEGHSPAKTWAELSLMTALLVIVIALHGHTSGNSHSSLFVVRSRQGGKLCGGPLCINQRARALSK